MAPPPVHPTYFPLFTNGTFSVPNYGSNPFLEGFEITIPGTSAVWLSAGTQFTINPGAARDFTSDFVISYNPYSVSGLPAKLNMDLNITGPLGCYPVAFQYVNITANIEALAVYAIGDSTGVNTTSAIVATGNNFLPPGYNKWRRIGTILLNNSSRQLVQMTQSGSGITKDYVTLQYMTGALYGPTTFFTIPLTSGVLPFSSPLVTDILYRLGFNSSDPSDYAAISQYNFAADTANLPFTIQSPVGSGTLTAEMWVPVGKTDSGHNVQYVTVVGSSPSLGLVQCGWRESMSLQLV